MAVVARSESLRTLPTDAIRQLMWRLSGRPQLPALLSAIEPILLNQRRMPGENAAYRLVDVWAAGEAGASLGFAAARALHERESLQHRSGIEGHREAALEYLQLAAQPPSRRDQARLDDLGSNELVTFSLLDAAADVLAPASSLWNSGPAAVMEYEAAGLAGRSGVDGQMHRGPGAIQWQQLSNAMAGTVFLAEFEQWIRQMRGIANSHAGTGACTVASAMHLWHWTQRHLPQVVPPDAQSSASRQAVLVSLAEALCWLVAARAQILDVVELDRRAAEDPTVRETAGAYVGFFTNLCHVQAARAAGEAGRICAELVYGCNRHPSWDDACAVGCCSGNDVDEYDALFPGYAATSRAYLDVVEPDGSHAAKAGPCARFPGLQRFQQLRTKLDGCLTGNRLAKDMAAAALVTLMHPEAADCPG